ncbi:glycosyltransferase [Limimaricola pyoseonensis]|uniref:Succinoglycan biosynthesis protein ExoM n=1 Tax=Limimaricola pyoseonensis TaxID=521013 RepID=A0A1G7J163_9RHOB|nr:glycosyltransferase family 2 protein [Limimaricola pyoseonensis]SDF18544.1 succinoglycan biosynthesis protein ExoM [Limimaricola pyoseonensis]
MTDRDPPLPRPLITICACTYRRPKGLTALLRSCRALRTRPDFDLRFVVLDNDDTPSAREVVARETRDFPWPCRYLHAPEPGIPVVRNRALEAAGETGFIVFVDDDETVTPDWLLALWDTQRATGATFVQGPVRMLVHDARDEWWLSTLFFRQRRFADRAKRQESWTNNVIVDLDFVARTGCRFEERLRYDGGTDTLFFQDIVRHGGRGAYAAEAWVCELQPKSRLTWRWAVNRQFRYGATRAMTVRLREPPGRAAAYCLLRGAGMAVVGTGLLASAALRGRVGIADGVALWSRAAGIVSGMAGLRKLEYAR